MTVAWAETEFAAANVWDGRCRRSLARIAHALERHHGRSFSAACGSARRQAAHRIFSSPQATYAGLLAGHRDQTQARALTDTPPGEYVLVAQDTTAFNYSTHFATTGLGPFDSHPDSRGRLGHAALAMREAGTPLGGVSLQLWARDPETFGKKHTRQQRATADKESQKWLTGLQETEAAFAPDQALVLLADREADVYDYFTAPRRPTTELLVRAAHARRVDVLPVELPSVELPSVELPSAELPSAELPSAEPEEDQGAGDLLTVAATAPVVGTWEVPVPARPARPGQAAQKARTAVLTLRRTRVRLRVPQDYRRRQADQEGSRPAPPAAPTLWVVEAREADPPAGVPPLHWVLLTTLPAATRAQVQRVVTFYTRRWGIERLHYTLKSGLGVERLQMDDVHTLSNALAVYYLVAWRLLWLTHHARQTPDAAPTGLLPPLEQEVLEAVSGQPLRTCRAVVRAIAKLGGCAGNPAAGEPGVKSLWLGLRQLEALTAGWRLARQSLGVPEL